MEQDTEACDESLSAALTVNKHGGRREDLFGNVLGGRPKKVKLNICEKPTGQLGVFEYMDRLKTPK